MAYISYKKLWQSGFDNIVSEKVKAQDLIINQLKLKVIDACERDEKITTNFELVNIDDVINKAYQMNNYQK